MYDSRENTINWKDLIIKIGLVIAFLFLLFWIIPRPNLNPFYDKIFNDNLQTMKNAAKSYYTVEKLPENIGDVKSMTLQEMLNNKMIIPFVDKDDKACDTTNSFIQVKKVSETEYSMKVQLSCGKHIDYILETIGCYDVCIGNECTQPLEYRFKKQVITDVTTYSCPAGYTKVGTKCYKSTTTSTKAIPVYGDDKTQITDANKNNGGSYRIYTDPIKNTYPGNYYCPSGYALSGSKCYTTTQTSIDAKWQAGNTTYSCPNGGTLSGTTCIKSGTSTYTATTTNTYSCPNGGTLSGTTCVKNNTSTYNATLGAWYTVTTYRRTSAMSPYTNTTERLVDNGTTREYSCSTPATCPVKVTYYNYTLQRKNYSCPNGGTLSGSKCTVSTNANYTATATPTYSCPNGGTRNGTVCTVSTNANYAATPYTYPGYYYCSSGYALSGSKCYITTNVSIDAYWQNGGTNYSCPSGYTTSGSGSAIVCYKTINNKDTYYCPDANATLKGDKCYKTVKGSIIKYTCSNPKDKLEGDKCYSVTNSTSINATKSTSKKSSWTYTWNRNKTLDGWTATGETRPAQS